ncbi:MAG: PriCT-2 domain-containing protein [Ruminiclostridium sp.]
MDNNIDLVEALKFISPAALDYQQWVNIGMALKLEGYSVTVWDNWSRNDSRYHEGECAKKWESFNGASSPVTGATIVKMAKENGFFAGESRELDWDDEIGGKSDGLVIVNKNWLEGKEINTPKEWNPAEQIIKYLETLFEAGENVGYVVESWEKDGKYIPANKGSYDRTAGQLI